MLEGIRQAFDVVGKRGAFDSLKESNTVFSMLAEAENKIVAMEIRIKNYEEAELKNLAEGKEKEEKVKEEVKK